MKHSRILLVLAFFTFSCKSSTDFEYDKEAVVLNNEAMNLIHSNPDSALVLLSQATVIDEDYYVAYNNQVSIYIAKGDYEKAIEASKLSLKAKPDLAEAVVMLGMLYDYTNQPIKASEQYQRAVQIFDSRLKSSNDDQKNDRVNRALALLLLGKVDEGTNEVQKILQEDPDNIAARGLVDFDKQEYLDSLLKK